MNIQRKKLAGALAYALGAGGSLLACAPAQAVDEKVYVTGYRVGALSAESPSPLQVITAEDIRASGALNIQDILLQNPTVGGTGTITRNNSNFQTSSAGVATVELRNLGTARTLVLINGRRVVSGVPGSSAVDLNTIPTNFIERIDILTGGASAAYGADAVAGVVNIILKRNFEGVQVDGQYGQSFEGDNKNGWVNATFGTVGAGGKANLMGFLGYSNQGPVYSKNRDATKTDQSSTGALTGDPAEFFDITRPFYSSFAPQGRYFPTLSTSGSRTFDKQGNLIPFSTNGPAGDGVGATGFNRSEFRTIAVPTERFLFSAKGDYNFFETHTAYFEGSFAQTQTTSKLEPFPMDSSGANGILPATGGRVPAGTLINGVVVKNPLIPTSLYNVLTDTNGDGIVDYGFTRRLTEVGNRGNVADRDNFRMVAGLRGAASKTWDYDVNIIYGSTTESQTSSGQVNVLNFRNALDAIPDANGNPICVDANARAQGCVPINIFGYNTISPAALKYVIAPGLLNTFTSQMLVTATVTGEPFQGPAGPVPIAIGAEYRNEYSRSEFDPLQQAGLNGGNALPPTKGSYHVADMFIETRLPLVKNESYAKALDLTGAVRGGKYSTVGTTLSYSAGVEWAPTSEFTIRGTAALATRAPDINELFSPPQQDFPTGLVDPCIGVTATSQGAVSDNCRAAPGVNQNIATNGVFTRTQADLQGISGYDKGNPDLKEEKGRSYTAGVIYKPASIEWLKNFLFTADYFNIKIDDAIVATPNQFTLDQCYNGNGSFCRFITRRPTVSGANSAGSLEFVDSVQTNSGGYATSGIDFTALYSDMVGPGRLNARFSYTHLFTGYLIPLPNEPHDDFAGEIGTPKNKWNLGLGYTWGPWGATLQTTFIGKSALDDQFLLSYDAEPRSATVSAKVYNDLQITYTAGKVQYYAGLDNVLGTKQAPIYSNLPGNNTGTETAAGTYDPIGRRWYAGVRIGL